jgi:hypothetical protein
VESQPAQTSRTSSENKHLKSYAVEITIEITHLTSFQPIQSNYLTTLSPTREVADKHLHMMCKSSTS